ncbi:hypothetical protein DOW39_07560 [Salmonella enterica subsp. enterica serovar Tanger]|nr:hypothetical protein [Salmonella enterica subsp. enterica serovar Tanger]EBV4601514.1 hypothetical protein [Salmonella enterica subsp. enterica serovar Tanger]
MDLGSAQNPHVLRVRSGFCALSVSKLAAPITPGGIGSKIFLLYSCSLTLLTHYKCAVMVTIINSVDDIFGLLDRFKQ